VDSLKCQIELTISWKRVRCWPEENSGGEEEDCELRERLGLSSRQGRASKSDEEMRSQLLSSNKSKHYIRHDGIKIKSSPTIVSQAKTP
jgi:cell wall assembly regulator SMI1